MRRFSLLLGLLLLLAVPACDTGGPDEPEHQEHEVRYRTPLTDGASGVVALSGGAFLVTGSTGGRARPADGTTGYEPLLVRVQADGTIADTTIYPEVTNRPEEVRYGSALAAVPLGDGRDDGLAVLTRWSSYRPEAPPRRLTLYRTGANGERKDVLFERADVSAKDLLRTADGGFLLTLDHRVGDDLVKLGAAGAIQWSYHMPETRFVENVAEAPGGDLWVLGVPDVEGGDPRQYTVARLSAGGRQRWQRFCEYEQRYETAHIAADREGAAVFGDRSISGSTQDSTVVTRLDREGAVQWERTYAIGRMTSAAVALPGGGWMFGYTEDYDDGVGSTRAHVVRLGPSGEPRWKNRFGPERGTTHASDMAVLEGGELAVVGSTGPERVSGFGGGDYDVLAAVYALASRP